MPTRSFALCQFMLLMMGLSGPTLWILGSPYRHEIDNAGYYSICGKLDALPCLFQVLEVACGLFVCGGWVPLAKQPNDLADFNETFRNDHWLYTYN